jgi:hypothetical protein
MVDAAIPVARATCAMPPYPIAGASAAAHTRRDRSVNTGDRAACFARRGGQIHTRTVPLADQKYKVLFTDKP